MRKRAQTTFVLLARVALGLAARGLAARGLSALGLTALGLVACGEVPLRPFPDRPVLREDDDRRPLSRVPAPRRLQAGATLIAHQLADPLDRWLRGGDGSGARNVNALGEVPASSWFAPQPRHRPRPPAALRRGAARTPGPSLLGAWTVTRAGADDAGPFVVLTDEDARRFLLRFDAPGHPGLATSASLVSTLALHALGYRVPERHLVIFPPEQLRPGPKALWSPKGPKALVSPRDAAAPSRARRLLTRAALGRLLAPLPRLRDGSLRGVATRLTGESDLGPFRFRGTRPDDPNDLVPHELRRELRGLLPIAAWLNLTGITEEVPRDLFDPRPDRRHVVHTLWDLRGSLGSTRRGTPKPLWEGFTPRFSLPRALGELVTLGFLPEPWARLAPERAQALGRWPGVGWLSPGEALRQGWSPRLSNEAFARAESADGADRAWGARLLASLRPSELGILVAEAYLPQPEAARLESLLTDRRRSLLLAHLGARAPFDHVTLASTSLAHASGAPAGLLCVVDLWQREGLSPTGDSPYEVRRRRPPRFVPEPGAHLPAPPSPRLCLELSAPRAGESYQVLELRRARVSPHWLRVHLRAAPSGGAWRLAGVEW